MHHKRSFTRTRLSFITGVIFILFSVFHSSYAQVINAYAKVTNISGNVLTLSNVNETYHTFTVGEEVIIMQMQDNVIGGTDNDSNFGSLGLIRSAGLYEVKTITAKTATSLTLNAAPNLTYNTGINSSVQVISFRTLGSPDYTTSADMAALSWDGNVGGVLAIKVDGIFTINHQLTANGAGFRGGAVSARGGEPGCNLTWTGIPSFRYGYKGEGIFKVTDDAHLAARGNILNGGGGGNNHNAGGGGGGNVTTGGEGGHGWNCSANPVGGKGGIALNSVINVNRIFMGGGGGGGQQNNVPPVGSPGARGGGIVLIRATQIATSGTCNNPVISANGSDALDASNDGAGGAGAGGSIVLDVVSFNVLAACPLFISANGGNGGSSVFDGVHGGGGGGGQGLIMSSVPAPAQVTLSTNNGISGCNNDSSPCNSQAPPPAGSDGAGINTDIGNTPLPVQLLYFDGKYNKQSAKVELTWATATETNNDYFTLERSSNGKDFKTITTIKGIGNTVSSHEYSYSDAYSAEKNLYYRLSQTDFDGKTERFKIIFVSLSEAPHDRSFVYPNPAKDNVSVCFSLEESSAYREVIITNSQAKDIFRYKLKSSDSPCLQVSTKGWASGVYHVQTFTQTGILYQKLVVE